MLSRRILIACLLLLTLCCGVPAQAKPLAAGAASLRQWGVLEQLTAYGISLTRVLKFESSPYCGTAYCPTPPGPPPPGQTMSSVVKPHPAGKGSLP